MSWGWVPHMYISKLTIIGSDNGLSPGWRQAIILTNAGILLIRPLETNFNEILTETYTFSLTKMLCKMSSGKWRPFCLSLNVLNQLYLRVVRRSPNHWFLFYCQVHHLMAMSLGPTWGPSGADRIQVGPMLAHELGYLECFMSSLIAEFMFLTLRLKS